MSAQAVLLPVFVQVVLMFALLFMMGAARWRTLGSGETRIKDIALGQQNWPARVTQVSNCFRNQFEVPVLFLALIALALPLRKADLVIVLLSWLFVILRLAHAFVFVTTNNVPRRGLIWLAGALVLAAMWLYFALNMLLAL